MNHNYYAKYKNILLRPLSHQDIEYLRNWRNDTNATRFLRPIGHITPEMQERWFENYLNNPNELTFAIVETEELNRLVGSISLYDVKDGVAEFGRIQIGDTEAHGKGIGRNATIMALVIGFKVLNLNKIVGSVHCENAPAYYNYKKIGFKFIGSHNAEVGGTEAELEIDLDTLLAVNPFADDIEVGVV